MTHARPIKRAILSVSDKTDIVPFAQRLKAHGVELLSTGGTALELKKHHIPVIDIADYTGFPEMMGGRVKTLHPKVHGAILAREGEDDVVLAQHGISLVDLVVVNLYPFEKAIQSPDCTLEMGVEHMDIGGPTLIRGAAKNFERVTVVVSPEDYPRLLEEMEETAGGTRLETRMHFAKKAFEHTAYYDARISCFLSKHIPEPEETTLPNNWFLPFTHKKPLRYGENPHQEAAFYADEPLREGTLAKAVLYQGKELSYNNLADSDAALECVRSLEDPSCVIIKHANPCGVASGKTLLEAYEKAFAADPTSAFGGVIAFNRPVDEVLAEKVLGNQFLEVFLAPDFSPDSLFVLKRKPNVRVMIVGQALSKEEVSLEVKRINGGFLVQTRDTAVITRDQLKVVTQAKPSEEEIQDMLFAWRVCKVVKSNAIVYAKSAQTLGVGAGQMSRVDSARIAQLKAAEAGFSLQGAVMASDAFFPFRDSVDMAAAAGIRGIIQPGGSIRDEEVIAAANEAGIAMVFTGIRHFRHS